MSLQYKYSFARPSSSDSMRFPNNTNAFFSVFRTQENGKTPRAEYAPNRPGGIPPNAAAFKAAKRAIVCPA
jgi:hypothetical protein